MKKIFPFLFCVSLYICNLYGAEQEWKAEPDDFLYLFLHPAVEKNTFTFLPQLKLAEEAGIKRYNFYWHETLPKTDVLEKGSKLFSMFTENSAKASLIPRLGLMYNIDNVGLTKKHAIAWKNKESTIPSWTSQAVQDGAVATVKSVVEYYESSPYEPRIWAYQIAAQETGEWNPNGYRNYGPDYSEESVKGFRNWLSKQYSTEKNLQEAWGLNGVTFANAEIPQDEDGRFPIYKKPDSDKIVEAFYPLPRQQNWVDYSKYVSDVNAESIRKLAAQVKESSKRKKGVITFYGYVFELPGSMCGHLRGSELLRDKNINALAAPISYNPYSQRLSGGMGAAMGAIDSLPLHQKFWINEDDYHTHAQNKDAFVPTWYWDPSKPDYRVPANLQESSGVLKRNLAFAAFHNAATWWMDLYGGGWYSDPGIWEIWKGNFGQTLRETRKNLGTYTPVVAVIVDEESRFHEKFTTLFKEMYSYPRNALMGTGTTVGFYYLDDYLEGLIPKPEATVFMNLWRLDDKRKKLLKARLQENGGVVIWQYAPGYMNPSLSGIDGVKELTGIQVASDDGKVGSDGVGILNKMKFGGSDRIQPRITISDPQAIPLASYSSDQKISAAMKNADSMTQVLIADYNWSSDMLYALLKSTKVHLMSSKPAVVQASESAMFVYALSNGEVTLTAPRNKCFENGSAQITTKMEMNGDLLLKLKPASH